MSCVPCQKLLSLLFRATPGDLRGGSECEFCMSGGCAPGIAVVKPRIGSVSSCSGEGRASGAIETRAAARRMVAAEVVTSALVIFGGRTLSEVTPKFEVRRSANEFLRRCEKPRLNGIVALRVARLLSGRVDRADDVKGIVGMLLGTW